MRNPAAMKRRALAIAIRRALLAWALLMLVACTGNTKPKPVVPQVVEVEVTRFVSVPSELSADCINEAPQENTYAEAKRLAIKRGEYLAECSKRMQRIRMLGKFK